MTITPSRLICAGVAALALHAAMPGLLEFLPPAWTHAIDPASCAWSAKPWARRLGGSELPRYTAPINRATWACQRARGLKMQFAIPFLKTILPRFPSRAELAAMSRQDTEDEDRDALQAPQPAAAGDVRPRAGG